MDRFLGLLGLALRAGKLAVGEEPVYAALRAGEAGVVFVARDAAEHTLRKLRAKLAGAAEVSTPYSKEELGRALGRKSCALAAPTDKKLARTLTERLSPDETQRQDGGVTI